MIEINLLPGSVKRTKRKAAFNLGGGSALSKVKLPPMDKYVMIAIGMWVFSILMMIYMQTSSAKRLKDATDAQAVAVLDTVKLSRELAQAEAVKEKHDTIATKIELIQNLDAGRFQWAHLLDEISRALPEATWLESITPADAADPTKPAFKIEGRMANAFALPKFMTDLENSPFVENVTLKNSGTTIEKQHSIYTFVVEGEYQDPPADVIHTVPLFGPDMKVDSSTEAQISADVAAGRGAAAPPVAAPKGPPGRPVAPATGRGAAPPTTKPAPKVAPGKKGGK
jgi:Tfp pilus assembly protein PilN